MAMSYRLISSHLYNIVGMQGSTSSPVLGEDDDSELDTIQDVLWCDIKIERRVGAGAFGEGLSSLSCKIPTLTF
jgi:hypothetical protein